MIINLSEENVEELAKHIWDSQRKRIVDIIISNGAYDNTDGIIQEAVLKYFPFEGFRADIVEAVKKKVITDLVYQEVQKQVAEKIADIDLLAEVKSLLRRKVVHTIELAEDDE